VAAGAATPESVFVGASPVRSHVGREPRAVWWMVNGISVL
jgi:hypothetical protein